MVRPYRWRAAVPSIMISIIIQSLCCVRHAQIPPGRRGPILGARAVEADCRVGPTPGSCSVTGRIGRSTKPLPQFWRTSVMVRHIALQPSTRNSVSSRAVSASLTNQSRQECRHQNSRSAWGLRYLAQRARAIPICRRIIWTGEMRPSKLDHTSLYEDTHARNRCLRGKEQTRPATRSGSSAARRS